VIFVSRNGTSADYPDVSKCATTFLKSLDLEIGSIIASASYFTKRRFVCCKYEGWNFNSGNYLFTTDTK